MKETEKLENAQSQKEKIRERYKYLPTGYSVPTFHLFPISKIARSQKSYLTVPLMRYSFLLK